MKTEKEKMLSGKLYGALEAQLSEERLKARLLIKELNDSRDQVDELRKKSLNPHTIITSPSC